MCQVPSPQPQRKYPYPPLTVLPIPYKSDVNCVKTANSSLSTVNLTLKTTSRQKSEPCNDHLKFPLVSEYQMRFSIAITVLLLSVICRATFSTRFLTPPNEIQPLIVTPKFQMQLILKTNHKPDLPCDLQLNRTIFHDTRVILVPKLTVFTPNSLITPR